MTEWPLRVRAKVRLGGLGPWLLVGVLVRLPSMHPRCRNPLPALRRAGQAIVSVDNGEAHHALSMTSLGSISVIPRGYVARVAKKVTMLRSILPDCIIFGIA